MCKTEMSLASNMRLVLCSSSQIESCSALSVLLSTTICVTTVVKERQCGPVVRALASRSRDHGFKTRSDHSLNLILVVPAALIDSQLVCLRPAGILNRCCCCVSLALKSTYGERSFKCVFYCIVLSKCCGLTRRSRVSPQQILTTVMANIVVDKSTDNAEPLSVSFLTRYSSPSVSF